MLMQVRMRMMARQVHPVPPVHRIAYRNRHAAGMLETVRLSALFICLVLSACAPSPPPAAPVQRDPTTEPWYGQTVDELTSMNRQANEFFKKGKSDEAAALIEKGEPMSARLLSVSQPTLAATEAASDLDQLYGEMLLSNKNYGWARLLFQKNVARWKHWMPQTPETAGRLKQAESAIAECDRRIAE